ncbi:MAG: ATP-dependent zinc metalloprotease FtsH [Planctomycetes bacterium]|nr:ATP-dependent zinc metalloprotease FtsH [Planctomycetota bacterium]
MASGPPEAPQGRPNQSPPPPRGPGRDGRPKPEGEEPPRPFRFGPWLVLAAILFAIWYFFFDQTPSSTGSRVAYTFFMEQVEDRNVKEVKFHGDILTGTWKEIPENPEPAAGKLADKFNTVLPYTVLQNADFTKELRSYGVEISAESREVGAGSQLLLYLFLPALLLIGLFWFMLRRSADPMGSGMMGNFIRSQARRFQASDQRTTFDDVAAMIQAKRELEEIVEFLKNPSKFTRLGAQIPKGVLLMGPPGTGKTLLARATAGEAGVPFFSINGSEFIQMFVGVGASRVRDLFRTAKEQSPCIVFIDEIDAVGRVRGAGVGGGHDEREQTLNQILSEMDGFTPAESVIVMAATNRPDVLDPALLRPGRFDRHITIDRPTKEGRVGILKVHCRKVPLGGDVDLERIAAGTIGFSGADIKNLVNEAALNAARSGRTVVTHEDFDVARDRVLMGPVREEVLNEKERRMTAYHEAGHAVLAWLLPEIDPVHKVTIIPRGRSLGVTQLMGEEERYHVGERRLHNQLRVALGGRAAEKLVFDEYSAGAEDDLKKATQVARWMVGHWGMSEIIGPVAFRHAEEHPFLGKEIHEQRQFSEETARIIDQEVQRFLTEAHEEAFDILTEHRDKLDTLVDALLERETVSREERTELFGERVPVDANGRKKAKKTAEKT